jgi:hypothetical protein
MKTLAAFLLAALALRPAGALAAGPEDSFSEAAGGFFQLIKDPLKGGPFKKTTPVPPAPPSSPLANAPPLYATLLASLTNHLFDEGGDGSAGIKPARCIEEPRFHDSEGTFMRACLQVEMLPEPVKDGISLLPLRFRLGDIQLSIKKWTRTSPGVFLVEERVFIVGNDGVLKTALTILSAGPDDGSARMALVTWRPTDDPAVQAELKAAAEKAAKLRRTTIA